MVRHVSTGGIIIEAPDTVLRQISLYCVTTILLLFSNMGIGNVVIGLGTLGCLGGRYKQELYEE